MKKLISVFLTAVMLTVFPNVLANAAEKAIFITFSKTFDATVHVGYAITREAITTPEGLTVTYKSSNPAVATVNESGRVVGKLPGKAIITASSGEVNATYNVTVVSVAEITAGTKVFEGINVTTLDETTPAVSVRGRTNDRNVMCFVSATDTEVGTILLSDYNTIIKKNRKIINLPDGGSYGVPPVDGISWEDWFADEFNKYRSLGSSSREEAVATNNAETIEKYRQEVIRLVNEEREKVGVQQLYADEITMEYSQTRAQELSLVDHDSYMNHIRPNGEKYWVELYEVHSITANENSAIGSMTPEDVVERWMNSDGHRANILNKEAYAIGVGCYWTGANYNWNLLFVW
jgi:uncharacterized protein YkwD